MSEQVKVAGMTRDNAVLLLAAAKDLGLHARVVQTTTDGHFLVPQEVAEKAGLVEGKGNSKDAKPAKKTAAKRTTSKKDKE